MKSSVKFSLIILTVFLALGLFFISQKPAEAQYPKFSVQFEWLQNSIIQKSLKITIENLQDSSDNLDLTSIINSTDFDISEINDVEFFEQKNTSYNMTVYDYGTCEGIRYNNETNQNETYNYSCITGSHEETRYKMDWLKRNLFSRNEDGQEVSHQWEQIHIGKANGQNNPKIFRLDFEVPIVQTGNGWGSKGIVWLDVNNEMFVDLSNSSWWNTNWNACRNLTNSYSVEIASDYVYKYIINSSILSEFNDSSSCAEVRFVNSSCNNGGSVLNHWIGNCNSSGDSAFFVKTGEVNLTNMAMYYDNLTAVNDISDGIATFEFFDDFLGDAVNTTNWIVVEADGCSVSSGNLHVHSGGNKHCYMNSTRKFSGSNEVNFRMLEHQDGGENSYAQIIFDYNYSGFYNGSFIQGNYKPYSGASNMNCFTIIKQGSQEPGCGSGSSGYRDIDDYSDLSHYQLIRNSTDSGIVNYYSSDFTIKGVNYENTTHASNTDDWLIWIRSWANGGNLGDCGMDFDWVFIREWVYPEPTYSIGAKETDTTPPSFSNHAMYPDPPNEDENVQVNVTVTDNTGVNTVLLEWNGTVNYTVNTKAGDEYYYTIQAGNYTAHDNITYIWYANDTFGNLNKSEQQSFTVVNQIPSTPTLANPANNSGVALGSPVPEFNWSESTDDDAEDTITYILEIYYSNNTLYNQTTTTNNYTTPTLPTGFDETYHWRVMANDSYNATSWSPNWTFVYANWTIIFNLTDSGTGEMVDVNAPNNLDISCNSVLNVEGSHQNPYTATDKFPPGTYSCTFDATNYYIKTQNITANNDTTIVIEMSMVGKLTTEEHTWLEKLYNCLYLGIEEDCSAFKFLSQINQTTSKIWNQFKRTDQSIVTYENITNKNVTATENLTINYTVNLPIKEGFTLGEASGEIKLDYLPIRISYWFLDENNESCYSQGNYPSGVERIEPYCIPLTAYNIGQVNSTINFTVELRPKLPAGTYYIVRNIEIDPQQIWIDYGQEVIGVVEVSEDNSNSMVSLRNTGTFPGTAPASSEPATIDEATDTVTGWSIGNVGSSIIAVISVIAVLGIAGYFLFTKKRNQYQGYSYKSY